MSNFFKLLCLVLTAFLASGCARRCCTLESLRDQNRLHDERWLQENEPEFGKSYTLEELIELALCHNLDIVVAEQEALLAKELAFGSVLRMMPNLLATYGNTIRDKNTASFSESLVPGVPPAPLSISLEKGILQWNVMLSWSTLDFGVALFKSRQDQGRYVIKELQVCRARNKVILDVVQAYWKVAATKRWVESAAEFLKRSGFYKERVFTQIENRWVSDLTALDTSRRLIDIEKDLSINMREYHIAKMSLAQLIGMNPCHEFDIVIPTFQGDCTEIADCETLEEMALSNRFELYEKDMEGQVAREQVREALVQMIPGVRVWGDTAHNSNRFLLFNNWLDAGYQLTWNLFQAPYWWQQQVAGFAAKRKITAERLQTSMAILVQVELSRLLVNDYREEFRLFQEDYTVKEKLKHAADIRLKTGEFHELQALIYEADALLSEIDMLKSYASFQGALEQLNQSIGIPLYYGSHTCN